MPIFPSDCEGNPKNSRQTARMNSKKLILIGLGLFLTNLISAQYNNLWIPDTLSGKSFNLVIKDTFSQIVKGQQTITAGINGKFWGPTLIIQKHDTVRMNVLNKLNDTTTLHWHGMHLPAVMDGGPYQMIPPNTTWRPYWKMKNQAGTYWFHPHLHEMTMDQITKGIGGLIIVRDSAEAALKLPRKYGVDDFPIIVQCQQYDSTNQAMPKGMQDSTLLVNGTRANNGDSTFLNLPAQVVRLRLLNASGERTFNFGFTGNMQFYQIASDGGLLQAPYNTTRIRLSPGERAEVLLNLNGMTGQTFYLMSYASELPMGIQGGPTMPMPNGPPMNSPLNGIDFNIMQLNVVAQTTFPVTTIPTTLTTVTPYLESNANTFRTIRFTADSLMVMDGPFYFNDSSFNMMRID
ncbi:MAG: bilirubin oxidase, partial [Bacteroidetes bacterium]|nr:bilirubin oxidase [Bacteroidota bacterium]